MRAVAATRTIMLLLALGIAVTLGRAAEPSAAAVVTRLDSSKEILAADLTAALKTNRFKTSYTTFEDLAISALEEILPRRIPGLTAKQFDDGKTRAGHEKNRLADFVIVCGANAIEVSIKAARSGGNPENDMGTFRDHPNRKKPFAASFTVWVRYDDVGGQIKCDRVFFDRTWRFVGKSSLVDGVKYRKKDGNMRPKPWAMFDSGESFWQSETDFETAVERAEHYRANELIKEYLDDLSDSDQRVLYEKLKEKFADPNR